MFLHVFVCSQGGLDPTPLPWDHSPSGTIPQQQAVRILLECFLVGKRYLNCYFLDLDLISAKLILQMAKNVFGLISQLQLTSNKENRSFCFTFETIRRESTKKAERFLW